MRTRPSSDGRRSEARARDGPGGARRLGGLVASGKHPRELEQLASLADDQHLPCPTEVEARRAFELAQADRETLQTPREQPQLAQRDASRLRVGPPFAARRQPHDDLRRGSFGTDTQLERLEGRRSTVSHVGRVASAMTTDRSRETGRRRRTRRIAVRAERARTWCPRGSRRCHTTRRATRCDRRSADRRSAAGQADCRPPGRLRSTADRLWRLQLHDGLLPVDAGLRRNAFPAHVAVLPKDEIDVFG